MAQVGLKPITTELPHGYGILNLGDVYIPVMLDRNGQRRAFPDGVWSIISFTTEAEARQFIAEDFDAWQDERAGRV